MNKKLCWTLLVAMLTTSCGEDQAGGSNVPVVPAATPTASPTPVPAPTSTATPVTPVSLTFSSISVAALLNSTGAATVYPAAAGAEAGSVVVSDPDAPAATSLEDLRLSGNETFGINRNQVGSSYSGLFQAASSTGAATYNFYAPGPNQPARSVPLFGWNNGASGSAAAELHLVQTQAVASPLPNPPASSLPAHARLLEAVFSDRLGIQIFGSSSPANALPQTNNMEYDGEVYGTAFTPAKEKIPFIGDATIYVDGAKTSGQIHGIIHISQFKDSGSTGVPIQINVVADIIGGVIVSRDLEVIGAGGMTLFGSVTGSFYGSTGNELGLVFSASGAPGSSIGGLIVRLKN